jgi:hypothetical protein
LALIGGAALLEARIQTILVKQLVELRIEHMPIGWGKSSAAIKRICCLTDLRRPSAIECFPTSVAKVEIRHCEIGLFQRAAIEHRAERRETANP